MYWNLTGTIGLGLCATVVQPYRCDCDTAEGRFLASAQTLHRSPWKNERFLSKVIRTISGDTCASPSRRESHNEIQLRVFGCEV